MGQCFIDKTVKVDNTDIIISNDDFDIEFDGIFSPLPYEKDNNEKQIISNEHEQKPKLKRINSVGFYIDELTKIMVKKPMCIDDFEIMSTIGKGKFGKVFLVKEKERPDKFWALKIMKKSLIFEKESVKHIKTERFLLAGIENPFIVNLKYAFHDVTKLYFVMEFVIGGDLYYHLKQQKTFSEKRTKFYAAEIFLALEYLHKLKVIHRDLKPENILLRENGHIAITDFGLSKILKSKKERMDTLVGTLNYLPPEMILVYKDKQKGYDGAVDWWGFGIFIFECLYGTTPFNDEKTESLFQKITYEKVRFPRNIKISRQAKNLIKKLLRKNPKKRLGSKSTNDIKKHAFFKDINFDDVLKLKYKPEYTLNVNGKDDIQFVNPGYLSIEKESKEEEKEDKILKSLPQLVLDKMNNVFTGFDYRKKTPQFKKNVEEFPQN